MDKYDELCERLMGMPSVMAMRDAAAAVRELKARLEIDPRHSIDGIAARDETIRMLEAKVAERDRVIQLLTNKTGPNSPASKCVEAIDRAERAESALADAKEKNGELHMVNRELHRQLAEAERKGERLKFHAEAMAHYTDCYKDKWPDSGARQALEEYRAEFKE